MSRTLLPVILLAVLACQPATMEMTDAERAEVEAAVTQAATEYNALWRGQDDLDGYMAYASDWAGTPWGCCATLDDLRSYATRVWERWDVESAEDEGVSVMVFSPDAAAVTSTGTSVRVDTAGVRQDQRFHIATLWVREAGQWKLLIAKNHVQTVGM